MSSQSYFAKQSEEYDKMLKSGLLGKIRTTEKNLVMEKLDPKKGESILDIPCGSGYYADFIVEAGADIYGIDLSPEMITVFQKKGFKGETGNLEEFSLEKKFDKVLSAGGFEFCKDHKVIINNLLTHTKTGGIIVLLLPKKSFFGYLYKLYHKICNKTTIVLFSENDVSALCKSHVIKKMAVNPCSLFSIVVRIEVK